MFVQVERNDGWSGIYECNRILTQNHGDTFSMILERKDSDTITVEVSKERDCGVYVMNSEGRTIQTIFRREGEVVSGSMPEK